MRLLGPDNAQTPHLCKNGLYMSRQCNEGFSA